MPVLQWLLGNRVSIAELRRVRRQYEGLLREKEKMIDELRAQNALLLKSALTQAEKRQEMGRHAKRLIEINRELKEKLARRDDAA